MKLSNANRRLGKPPPKIRLTRVTAKSRIDHRLTRDLFALNDLRRCWPKSRQRGGCSVFLRVSISMSGPPLALGGDEVEALLQRIAD
jgi:hypothetical protein